jgi:hypothetical protein
MSEPSKEHLEAVAEHLAPKPLSYYRQGYHGTEPDAVRSYFKRAERILTSTDPAVLDAMQDALVRAGRLEEETSGVYGVDLAVTFASRFVTEWQEVGP